LSSKSYHIDNVGCSNIIPFDVPNIVPGMMKIGTFFSDNLFLFPCFSVDALKKVLGKDSLIKAVAVKKKKWLFTVW
jgi:hypothetical protein